MVIVSPSDLGTVEDHGSVWVVTGTSEDCTKRVTFAGDWRPMRELVAAIVAMDEPVPVAVESWQVQRVESALLPCGCPKLFVQDCGHQEGCFEVVHVITDAEAWVWN
jgi:hypothetical protein